MTLKMNMKILAAALALPGAALAMTPPATPLAVPAAQAIDFEVFLPLRDQAGLERLTRAQVTKGGADYHRWLTPAQFGARFGPSADTMNRASGALEAAGLAVTAVHTRSLHVTTTAALFSRAFQTRLILAPDANGSRHIAATPRLTLPALLASEGAVIPAFVDMPDHQVFSRFTPLPVLAPRGDNPENRVSNHGPYYYNDLKEAYDYPAYNSGLNGAGVHVAILMADLIKTSDITLMFNHENYTKTTGLKPPTVTTLLIDGGGKFGGPATPEASLDTQEVLGGAPSATVTLYSLPDLSESHILDGLTAIVDRNIDDVVSGSFGGCELFYTAAYNNGVDQTSALLTENQLFLEGNSQGITFIFSSDDQGGLICPTTNFATKGAKPTFVASVAEPAANTNVTAVGGGNLITYTPPSNPPQLTTYYIDENAFGDPLIPEDSFGTGIPISGGYWAAGGGLSVVWRAPYYQAYVYTGASARTVPDVGMQVGGCPSSAVQPCGVDRSSVVTWTNGKTFATIGTSVAAPEFAGAVALFIQKSGGRLGNLNPYLYALGSAQTSAGGRFAPADTQFYHTAIDGFDGVWTENQPQGFAYDYLVGNGTPDVRKLFGMTGFAPAGSPQTPSNP